MSGTQIFVIVLVLGIGSLALMFTALRSRTPTTAEIGVGDAFSFRLSLTPADKSKAANAAEEAAKARGQSGSEAADLVRSRVSSLEHVRSTRVLWVDDHPDNNVHESLALMHLGVFITTATSNSAARIYLGEMQFDLVITDLGRGLSRDNGFVLVKELHADRPGLPIVVYTVDAIARRADLVSAGAVAVEEEPGALIDAVLAVSRSA